MNNPHEGSELREFLDQEALLHEVELEAVKKAISIQIYHLMEQEHLSKSALAKRMGTSRAVVHRLLDSENTSITLSTLGAAAKALGKQLKIDLLPAN